MSLMFFSNLNEWLSHVAASINSSYNESINETPHFILFGVDKRLPYDMLLAKPQPLYVPENFAKVQITSVQRIHQTLRAHLRSSTSQAIARQHKSARPPKFKIGNTVFLINFTRDNKLAPKHLGPCRIIAKAGNKCTIRDVETHDDRTVHMTHLRMMSGTLPDPQPQSSSPLPRPSPTPRPLHQIFPSPPPHPYHTRSRTRH
ncbi:hypothetical protein GWK47_014020 [Chionoecetes opilio]|uniref:Uncharacterized protein n=1 Tax=Chionoecetes opilio TaxID=41210 RepID=A0A8J5C0V0_CHIOP|nr:hypothetical protein GWK47_014020 [Chionoecetes opilio]